MEKNCRIFISFLFFISFIVLLHPGKLYAADVKDVGIAIDVEIKGAKIPDGSIISLENGIYKLSSITYDGTVFGVVTEHPAVAFIDQASADKHSVLTFGKTRVRISSINGNIKKGDLITTSSIPGVGQKATENGYVIGVAQEDYESNNPKTIGSVYITLHLNFGMVSTTVRENLISSLKSGARAPFSSPLNALRYLVAGLITIISFAAGLWFFGRISSSGVEAIGRNPLARKFILLSVMANVSITIVVMGLGVALAYVILVI